MNVHTRYRNMLALSELPYFELREGRLALRDRSLGPAIDVHTHLALAYVRPMRVDLHAAPRPARHYLPAHRPLDLDVYLNRNFTRLDIRRLALDLTLLSPTSRGMRRTHTIPNLLREMDELGIAASVTLAIDWARLSWNSEAYIEAARGEPRIVPFASVHPGARDAGARVDRFADMGARGVKVHPAVQLVSPSDPRAMPIYRRAAERGLPVLWHCGPVGIEMEKGRRLSQVDLYEPAIRDCPETTFVLGHSGALQFEKALSLAQRYDNVWLELSCQAISNVRRMVEEAPSDRVVFGSDWPFYHEAIPLAKLLLATEDRPEVRERFLWRNAERLLGIDVGELGWARTHRGGAGASTPG